MSRSRLNQHDATPASTLGLFCLSLVLLMLFIGSALVASFLGIGRHLADLSVSSLLIVGFYFLALLAALDVWTRLLPQGLSDAAFLFVVCLAALLIRLFVVLSNSDYADVGDGSQMHSFVIALAQHGLNAETLSSLSRIYDYPVWLSRSFPLFLPLRWLFGEHDLVALRIINCFLSTAIVAMTFVLGRHFFRSIPCRYGSLLMAAFPFHVLDVLNYTPQIPGTLLFMLCIWVLLRSTTCRWASVLGWGLLFGFLLFLVRIQRALDLLVLPLALLLIVLLAWIRIPGKRWQSVLMVVLISLFIYLPAAILHGHWISSHDTSNLRSHVLGFVSRGWNPVTLGEYFDRYEELDIATPPEDKTYVLVGVIASQVVYRPLFTLGILPWIKIAKFFLVGYASGVEEGLSARAPSAWVGASIALRIVFAPLFLALVLAGAWRLAKRSVFDPWTIYLVLISIAACLATLLFGETSPRYSHCVHFSLALIAGLALSGRGGQHLCAGADCRLVPALGVVALLYFLTAGLVYGGARYFGRSLLFERMDSTTSVFASRNLSHVERTIQIPSGGQASDSIEPARVSLGPADLSVYVYVDERNSTRLGALICELLINGQRIMSLHGSELVRVRRVDTHVRDASNLKVEIRALDQPSEGLTRKPVNLHWGYLRVRPSPSAERAEQLPM